MQQDLGDGREEIGTKLHGKALPMIHRKRNDGVPKGRLLNFPSFLVVESFRRCRDAGIVGRRPSLLSREQVKMPCNYSRSAEARCDN